MTQPDYKSSPDGDLLFENGDLVVHDATDQHQVDILMAGKGHYRNQIDLGVDAMEWLDDDALGDLPGVIRQEFEKDGLTINRLRVTNTGKIDLDAEY